MQTKDGSKSKAAVDRQRGTEPPLAHWSSPRVFVWAAAGAAIGFNNFWQFPAITAQYGGGAYVIVYLACVALLGVPLLMAEIMLGRRARASPIATFRSLLHASRSDPSWVVVGWLAVIGGFVVFCYLGVIAGWTLAFMVRAAFGAFSGLTADGVAAVFTALVHDPEKQLFWHMLFIAMTMAVTLGGVRAIEMITRWVWPAVVLLLGLLLAYAVSTDVIATALARVFMPDFARLDGSGVLTAAGQAFFSLGLGVGVMLMYSAYAEGEFATARSAIGIAAIDTVVGLAAAVVVVTLLAAGGVEPAGGPALVFEALPLAFDHLTGGALIGSAFFLLLALVAWLAAVALVEPVVVWLQEARGCSRLRACALAGLGAWLLGVVFILSFNHWAFEFKLFDLVRHLGLFDVAQLLTAQVLLPLCGILTALFAGWALRSTTTREWLGMRSLCGHDLWLWLNRLLIPVLLTLVLFNLSALFL